MMKMKIKKIKFILITQDAKASFLLSYIKGGAGFVAKGIDFANIIYVNKLELKNKYYL